MPNEVYYSPYIPPPPAIRYTLERWTNEDIFDNVQVDAAKTYAPTYCISCYGAYGDYQVGEYVIDDTLSIDTFHISCAPRKVRWLALLGLIVCAFRAIMGIDAHDQ